MRDAQFKPCVTFIILIFLGLSPSWSIAQSLFEGQVFNKRTETPIAGVTVTLQKEKLATSSNDQGYFNLRSSTEQPNDTLIFKGIGYVTLKIPVANFDVGMQVLLTESTNMLEQVDINVRKLKVERLNAFSFAHIREDPMGDVRTRAYTTTFQYAKLFVAPYENVMLHQIDIGRRNFNPSFSPVGQLIKSKTQARFKLHIMQVDPKTGGPGKILFSKDVLLRDNSLMIAIDLSKDQIVLKDQRFFVAVEWLHIPFNELVKLEYAAKVNKINRKGNQVLEGVANYRILYQPALIEYDGWKPAESWVMKEDGRWRMNPPIKTNKGSDVALSATIKY